MGLSWVQVGVGLSNHCSSKGHAQCDHQWQEVTSYIMRKLNLVTMHISPQAEGAAPHHTTVLCLDCEAACTHRCHSVPPTLLQKVTCTVEHFQLTHKWSSRADSRVCTSVDVCVCSYVVCRVLGCCSVSQTHWGQTSNGQGDGEGEILWSRGVHCCMNADCVHVHACACVCACVCVCVLFGIDFTD